ncbi:sensor histidine kinase [Streptomyces radicis]|uniref:histidine kinase n=1 Tax=Streptomyces radicis TaxID=1750517 RepID=A0A3A9W9Q1_9ACTN|nr:histidine kinase [Streptomyces radicis]RKN09362.1 two-component sensor histidine kinase [Streptomyces radicis]RKN23040.1 two-component sensor histidine kinase [Streptomyces radicis]
MSRPAPPHRHDVWIALAGLAGGLLGIAFGLYTVNPERDHGPAVLVGLLLMCGAELLRRTAPGWALGIAVVALVVDIATGGLLAVLVMFTDVLYATTLYGPARVARALAPGSVVFSVAATVGTLAWLRAPEALLLGVLAAGVTATPVWTGLMLRQHREAAAAERLRAEQTALLAEMDRAQAVAAERSRMARELHDRVANHLSAIAIHATAALTLDERDAARDALGVIRENSTQGLTEMRRLIGLLREAGGGHAVEASPSLDALDALLGHAERAGAAGGLTFKGLDERPPRAARLSTPVELAAYRIVQEALANAVKHAAPGEVTVVLRQDAGALTVTVTSPFHERTPSRAPGAGAGLIGMRERVDLLDGAFAAGPTGAHRWRVHAELPLGEGKSPA